MSTWVATTVTCPRCAHRQPARIAEGVHITRVPRVRDEVLARRFQMLACAQCAAGLVVDEPFVYTDFARHQWLLVAPRRALAEWPAWETRLRTDLARAFEHGSPIASELGAHMLARVVFGFEALREKLVIWAAGIEDAQIECIKLRAIASELALAAPGSRLFVDAVGGDASLRIHWFAANTDLAAVRRLDLPASWVQDTERDRERLRGRFPELWSGGFVDAYRLMSATM
jgi:CpXC motif protein